MSFGKRLKAILEKDFKTIKAACDELNVSQSLMSKYFHDKVMPGYELFNKLSKFGVNINWLISGIGNPYQNIDKYSYEGEIKDIKILENNLTHLKPAIFSNTKKHIFKKISGSSNNRDEFIIATDSTIDIPYGTIEIYLSAFIRYEDKNEFILKNFKYYERGLSDFSLENDPSLKSYVVGKGEYSEDWAVFYSLGNELYTRNDFLSKCQYFALLNVTPIANSSYWP